MHQNIGTVDRILRLLLGLVAAAGAVLIGAGWAAVVLVELALWLLSSGAVGWCPVYRLLRITTARTEHPLVEAAGAASPLRCAATATLPP